MPYTAIRRSISSSRLSRFEQKAANAGLDPLEGVDLYEWNAILCSALLVPFHITEITIRNATHYALEATYGLNWPWDNVFRLSLPSPNVGFSPRREIQKAAGSYTTTGKVIPELKFKFWEDMFTTRHNTRLWQPELINVLPGAMQHHQDTRTAIMAIRADLESIRLLRNRVAHHEPIIDHDVPTAIAVMTRLTGYSSPHVADWLTSASDVLRIVKKKPGWAQLTYM